MAGSVVMATSSLKPKLHSKREWHIVFKAFPLYQDLPLPSEFLPIKLRRSKLIHHMRGEFVNVEQCWNWWCHELEGRCRCIWKKTRGENDTIDGQLICGGTCGCRKLLSTQDLISLS
ncbi:hypothetical protein MKX01_014655 [Papaver californicum]|nr:hypothetical protein MKX01_014655 [Papaver californicum]